MRPVVIHRAVFGSIDRFLGILIEHFGGAFPTWLAPQQVQVIGVAEAHQGYAKKVVEALQQADIRVQLDDRQEKLGKKIREAQLQKIPYIVVIGDREVANQTVAVRRHGQQNSTDKSLQQLIEEVTAAIQQKSLA